LRVLTPPFLRRLDGCNDPLKHERKIKMTTENKGPVETLRDGNLKATIWRNFGENGTFYSVEISRTYKDGDDYKTAHSFSGAELLKVSRLALDGLQESRRSDDYRRRQTQSTRGRLGGL